MGVLNVKRCKRTLSYLQRRINTKSISPIKNSKILRYGNKY